MLVKKPFKESFLENEYVELWIEDGILMEIFKPQVSSLQLTIAKKVIEDRLTVSNGVTRPLFVDLCNVKSIDAETRKFFAADYSLQYINVSAFLMHSYVSYYGGKLFLMFDKPKVKTELFRSQAKAIEWLKLYVTSRN